jgi:hypothetical protein
MLSKQLSNILTLLEISLPAEEQRTGKHLLRVNEVRNVLKSLIFLLRTLKPAASKSEVRR